MALVVEVRGITKSFGVPVVDGVSLAVQAGAALGVVGPNGAGKTTLLNLIAGDLRPDSGAVLLNGADVTSVPSNRRCRDGLARTSQVPRPFEGMTVLENALVGATYGRPELRKPSQRVEAAAEALRRTGMLAKANQAAGSLALLDRKRLELSRALATDPHVLLLDEIAGGLTEGEVRELVDLVKSIHADGVTLIWIEHIVHALMAVVTSMMAMSFGTKIAEGDPEEVMTSPKVREVYLGAVDE